MHIYNVLNEATALEKGRGFLTMVKDVERASYDFRGYTSCCVPSQRDRERIIRFARLRALRPVKKLAIPGLSFGLGCIFPRGCDHRACEYTADGP